MKFEVFYGVGKTTKAIAKAKINKLISRNKTYVYIPSKVWKPCLASHNGDTYPVSKELINDKSLYLEPNSTIIVDDAQFLTRESLGILIKQAITKNVTVYCFCEFKNPNGGFTRVGCDILNAATNIKEIKLNKFWEFIKRIFKFIFRR